MDNMTACSGLDRRQRGSGQLLPPVAELRRRRAGNNYSRWCSPAFDQLLDDAVTTPQLAFRLRNYYYAQSLLNEQLPLIPLAHALRTQVSRSDIQG
jgi:ABC-type oligopeptide transport system substrate-binding subunit